jgi:hypothetical protein
MLQVLGTRKAYQQEPLQLKDRSVPPDINCLKNGLVTCCGNASSGNYKLIFVVFGKVKKTQSFKGTEAN